LYLNGFIDVKQRRTQRAFLCSNHLLDLANVYSVSVSGCTNKTFDLELVA
jgi:hypothetical protein